MENPMTRRVALILGLVSMLFAILACNLPSEIDPKTITQTAIAIASATGVSNLTVTANAQSIFQTQTAFAPASDTPPPPPATASSTLAGLASLPSLNPPGAASTDEATAVSDLKVGDIVKVFTTEGDKLNLRKTPDKSGDVIKQLANGTKLTLLEGPRVVNGDIWWKVKVSVTNEV